MITNSQWQIDRNGEISVYDKHLAGWVNKKFGEHRNGVASQRVLKSWHNGYSFLGEHRMFKWFIDTNEKYEWSGWKTEEKGDKWDFTWRGYTVDNKNRQTEKVWGDILDYEVIIDAPTEGHGNQIEKQIDIYTFTLVINSLQEVWILGWSDLPALLQAPSCRYINKGELMWPDGKSPTTANKSVYLIKVRDLEPIGSLLDLKAKEVI